LLSAPPLCCREPQGRDKQKTYYDTNSKHYQLVIPGLWSKSIAR
jgi:hypothetical protein